MDNLMSRTSKYRIPFQKAIEQKWKIFWMKTGILPVLLPARRLWNAVKKILLLLTKHCSTAAVCQFTERLMHVLPLGITAISCNLSSVTLRGMFRKHRSFPHNVNVILVLWTLIKPSVGWECQQNHTLPPKQVRFTLTETVKGAELFYFWFCILRCQMTGSASYFLTV